MSSYTLRDTLSLTTGQWDNWLDSIRRTKEELPFPGQSVTRCFRTDIGDEGVCKSPKEEEDPVSKVLTMPVKIAYLLL